MERICLVFALPSYQREDRGTSDVPKENSQARKEKKVNGSRTPGVQSLCMTSMGAKSARSFPV